MNIKIRPTHLSRPAVVYIRQSTLMQVLEHQESTERQYDLAALAEKLGWDAAQIQVIDEDLGKSGKETENRSGFQRLAAQVSLGKVGAILSLEVSRLARSSADWHRLLDLCALSDTRIIDDDGVYDPNDFNDRLVLGLKGTMSDAERHMMRLRLFGGKLHKAKKGELGFAPPTGYVFDGGVLCLDPDEQVTKAVHLLFERFRLAGSAYGVVHYFAQHGLLFPSRHAHKESPAEVRWNKLTHSRTLVILKSPLYTGAYVWGRRRERRGLTDGAIRQRREVLVERDQWHSFRPDSHPAYISWQEYLVNLQRLKDNDVKQHADHAHGAPRDGSGLLQGLALCGRCGRRMKTFHRRAQQTSYECSQRLDGGPSCWSVMARSLDDKVVEVFLSAMAPPELELSLSVLKEVEHQAAEVDQQWKLRLERVRYEAARAERQYHAVEPENRIVVRTLETRWNQKLQEVLQVEREYEEARRAHKLDLSDDDKQAIRTLAADLPKVWNAQTTTTTERKQLLRLVIEDIVLCPVVLPHRATQIRILWKTGAVTEATVQRPTSSDRLKTPPEVLALITEQVQLGKSNVQIAEDLNQRKLKSGLGREFTRRAVSMICQGYGLTILRPAGVNRPGQRAQERDPRGRYSITGLVARYHVTSYVVRYWVQRGVLTAQRDCPGGPLWFDLTPDAEARIAEALRTGYGPRTRQ
jgi:DNA invertase Pin-like site-specific DNA recombinase/uncharacterized protein YndB with AHSA1/START domain